MKIYPTISVDPFTRVVHKLRACDAGSKVKILHRDDNDRWYQTYWNLLNDKRSCVIAMRARSR